MEKFSGFQHKAFIGSILAGVLLLVGCSGGKASNHRVLQLNFKQDVPSLDPADLRSETGVRMAQQVFTGLVALDDSLHVVPALARSWTIGDGGKTYRFRLRDDVHFHPHPAFGTPDSTRRVTARDVVYSLTRIVTPETASVGAWVFNGRVEGVADYQNGDAESVSGFVAHNDTSLSIHLKRPFRPFLAMLTMPYAYVVPREVVESAHDFQRLPIGSGPFSVFKRKPGQYTILHPNPKHYARTPEIDAVKISFVGEPTTQYTRLKQGRLHLLENPPPAIFRELINPAGNLHAKFQADYRYHHNTQLSTAFLGINIERAHATDHPLASRAARQALSEAIPRNQLRQVALGCTPTESLVPPALLLGKDSAPVPIHYEDIKWQKSLTLHIANTERRMASFLQSVWQRAKIDVKIQEHQGAALRNLVVNGEVTLWLASWVADYPDAESFYALAHGPLAAPEGPNRSRYHNADFDGAYQQLIAGAAPPAQLHAKMQRILARDLPVIPLYHYSTHWILPKAVQGLRPSPSSLSLDLQHVKLE